MFIDILIFIIGFIASFIGATAGGAALVITPALMVVGLSPAVSIATAKFAGIVTQSTSLARYAGAKKVDWYLGAMVATLCGFGSILGALLLVNIPVDLLQTVAGYLMLVLLIVSWLKNRFKKHESSQKLTKFRKTLRYPLYLLNGIWGGFFPGQGIITTYIMLFTSHKSMIEISATRVLSSLFMCLIPSIIFIYHGLINWFYGLILLVSCLLGSYVGSTLALKKGDRWVQLIFNVMVLALAGMLIFSHLR